MRHTKHGMRLSSKAAIGVAALFAAMLPALPLSQSPIVPVALGSNGSPVTSPDLSCPLAIGSLKLGAPNDPGDVIKLQAFLKSREGADVDPTGIFDEKTEAAVKAFQMKHAAVILAPWGATRASGIVYITTSKVIDREACGIPLSLGADELAAIESYRAAALAAESSGTVADAPVQATSSDPLENPPRNEEGRIQTATVIVAGDPLSRRFLIFLEGLFR